MTRTIEELDAEVADLRRLVDRLAGNGNVRVGDNVFFFANDAPGTPPQLAQVTNVSAPFLVDLKMWNGEREVGKTSVHSREFAIQKQLSKAQITQMGIWQSIDSHYKTVDAENARLNKLRTDREAEVRRMHAEKAAATPAAQTPPQSAEQPAGQGQRRPVGKA